ncbi:MAG: hypothetical protein VX777_01390 [Chlamydiota bacterium]|nr:hypothetical protein [Chlamydiota bacterium]
MNVKGNYVFLDSRSYDSTLSLLQERITKTQTTLEKISNIADGVFCYLDKDGELQTFKPHNPKVAAFARNWANYIPGCNQSIEKANEVMDKAIDTVNYFCTSVDETGNVIKKYIEDANELPTIVKLAADISVLLNKFENLNKKLEKQAVLFQVRDDSRLKKYTTLIGNLSKKVSDNKNLIEGLLFNKNISKPECRTEVVVQEDVSESVSEPKKELNIPLPPPLNLPQKESNIPLPPPMNIPPPPGIKMKNSQATLTPEEKHIKSEKIRLARNQKNRLNPINFYSVKQPSREIVKLLNQLITKSDSEEEKKGYQLELQGEKTPHHFKGENFKALVSKFTNDELRLLLKIKDNIEFDDNDRNNFLETVKILEENKSSWVEFFTCRNAHAVALKEKLDSRNEGKESEPDYAPRPYDPNAKKAKINKNQPRAGDRLNFMEELSSHLSQPGLKKNDRPKNAPQEDRNQLFKQLNKVGNSSGTDISAEKIGDGRPLFQLKKVKLSEDERKQKLNTQIGVELTGLAEKEMGTAHRALLEIYQGESTLKTSVQNFSKDFDRTMNYFKEQISNERSSSNDESIINQFEIKVEKIELVRTRFDRAQAYIKNPGNREELAVREFLAEFEETARKTAEQKIGSL